MFLILNGYRDRGVWVWGALLFPSFSLIFVGLDEKWSWRKKGGHMRRIVSIESVAAGIKKLEDQLGRTKCPSPHTRVALKLTVSFRTCTVHCNIFPPLITTHNASEFVYSNSCIAVTIQTHAHMNVFSHNDRYHHITILILYVGVKGRHGLRGYTDADM